MIDKEPIKFLLHSTNELINDLKINNPTYHFAINVGENPVITSIAAAFSLNPMWFAKPIHNGRYVQYDLDKIQYIKAELESNLLG